MHHELQMYLLEKQGKMGRRGGEREREILGEKGDSIINVEMLT